MKVVILCGGLGTRLSEETDVKPKPMVTIGGHPMLWHIMNLYDYYGFQDFVLALGYKGHVIKEYFLNYHAFSNDLYINLSDGSVEKKGRYPKNWKIDLIDTGLQSMTGGRLHRLEPLLRQSGTFMVTYGDGLSNINLKAVLDFHYSHKRIATVTAVRPMARFGCIEFDGHYVKQFREKSQIDVGWVNGGFFVFEPAIFDYLDGDSTVLEASPLERLASDGELVAYKHDGFWQCMDTQRDRLLLEEHWKSGHIPWQTKATMTESLVSII